MKILNNIIFLALILMISSCGSRFARVDVINSSQNQNNLGFVEFYGLGSDNQMDQIVVEGYYLEAHKSPIHGLRFALPSGTKKFTVYKGNYSRSINIDVKEGILTLVKIESSIQNTNSYVSGNTRFTNTSFRILMVPYPTILPVAQSQENFAKLSGLLKNDDWVIRWHAAELIAKYNNIESKKLLLTISKQDSSGHVKQKAKTEAKKIKG